MQRLASENSSANLFDISIETYKRLQQDGLSLDQLFLLEKISKEIDIGSTTKMKALLQTLIRKGLLSETGKITQEGILVLTSLREGIDTGVAKETYHIQVETAFDRWWKTYPVTDFFEHKGKTFPGSRGLRKSKEECRTKFTKILNEGEYTADDMIRALQYEVMLKKEASLASGENKMRFMQGSTTYLNQRTFENFIEISKQPAPKRSSDTLDI